mmetsp:Transcript_18708/g.29175  ORF Transcript_18708/g.29175 Transcript_18708/m.29175 type:complete len:233 (+) Transcript_18708:688-1386(+)
MLLAQISETLLEVLPNLVYVVENTITLYRLQHRFANPHRHRSSPKGVKILHAVGKGVSNLFGCHYCCEGKPIAHRLPHCYNIRLNSAELKSPHLVLACSCESTLYLVTDTHSPSAPDRFVYIGQVSWRESNVASSAKHSLAEKGSRLATFGPDLIHGFLNVGSIRFPRLRVISVHSSEHIRARNLPCGFRRSEASFSLIFVGRDLDQFACVAVISSLYTYYIRLLGVLLHHP